jgi:hypothetical protein
MFVTRGRGAHLAVLALVTLGLTACGSDQSSEATGTGSSTNGMPACTSVWQDGATLPRTYGGCVQDDQVVAPDSLGCSSGQRIIRYADSYYAVPGGTVHAATKPLNGDRQYIAAVHRCRA